MKYISRLRYRDLYRAWGLLFALTALLGLLFPGAEGFGRALMMLLTMGFFLPPWLILIKAKQGRRKRDLVLIRCLSLGSLCATLALICAGILSIPLGDTAGDLIHALMSILCAPLTCGNFYVIPIFLWATLLFGSFGKSK